MANPSLCLYPYVQVSTIPSGFVRPCCYYTEFLDLDGEKGRRMNVARHSLASVWNSSEMKRIRREMEAGPKLQGCQQCYQEDRVGTTSLRLRSFKEWGHHPGVKNAIQQSMANSGQIQEPIRYLELKPGNLCNLKCRMCNQFDSCKVVTEMKELAEKYKVPHLLTQARLLDEQRVEADFDISRMPDWSKLDQFWEEANSLLPHLEAIPLAGGEPMILENVARFLEKAVETGHSRHIKVFLASNFTHFRENFFEIAANFELFEFIANRTLMPGLIVDAVVCEPYGAHPSYVQGYYDRYNSFYLSWDENSQDPAKTAAWLQEWVYDIPDRAAYLAKLGQEHLATLAPGDLWADPVNYGRYA